jgi:hypothetical protein
MPSDFIREDSVDGGTPSFLAAPWGPETLQLASSSARVSVIFSMSRRSSFVWIAEIVSAVFR